MFRRLMFCSGISNLPFAPPQLGKETTSRYVRRVASLLAFLMRDKGEYSLTLPLPLSQLLHKVGKELPNGVTNKLCNTVLRVLISLWTTEWPPAIRSEIYDPTICYLTLMSINDDGTFAEPYQITNPIASLEFCMRACFVVEMHLNADPKQKTQDLNKQCDLLSRWFTEKHESTFNSLRSLQHRATALALSTPAAPRVWWADEENFDIMFYAGNKIEFSKFPEIFKAMEVDLIALWENRILRGLKLLTYYDEIMDDMSNKSDRYSFIIHPKNKCFANRDRLAAAISKDPEQSGRFLTGIRGPDGNRLWNVIELRRWLLDYSLFHCTLMTRTEMTAGSPARLTEVSCIEYCNTKARQDRGLYMMGKYLAVLCRYHKSRSMTSKDKLIPHALDAISTSLLIQDLSIARPFAELAVHLCFPNRLDIQSLYRTFLFVNNGALFQTNDITKRMRFYTGQTLGYEIGVADWRHISIAIRRKQSPKLLDLADKADENTASALQASHSMQTENRIYGLDDSASATGTHLALQSFLTAKYLQRLRHVVVKG
jgi:hypothetical protein